MKRTIIIIGAIFIVVITVIIIFFKKNGDNSKNEATSNISPVRYVAAEGKVEVMPGFEVEIGSELDGKIAEFFVEEGDSIKKGALIARLENNDIQAKVKEAKAELFVAKARLEEVASGAREEEIKKAKAVLEGAVANNETARKELERYEQLFKEKLVAKSAIDEKERTFKVATAKVKEAEEEIKLLEKGPKPETIKLHENSVKRSDAAVEYLKSFLGKTFITAPISGKVIKKNFQKGEVINKEMQTAIVTIADIEKIRINAEIDETDIGRVRAGDIAEVASDAFPGEIFKGEVREINDYVGSRKVKPNDPAKNLDIKVVQVKIELKEKTPFKLGMTVDVRILPRE